MTAIDTRQIKDKAVITVADAEAALELAFSGQGETFYDVTLTEDCTLTVAATGKIAGRSLIITFRGPFNYTFGMGAAFANGARPIAQCTADLFDKLQIIVEADGTLLIVPVVMGAGYVAPPSAPNAPTLTVTPATAANSITWVDGSANGSPITSHKLYRSTVSGGTVFLANVSGASPYADTGLTNGVEYFYQLSAVNALGESPKSAEDSGIPVAGPHYLSAPGATAQSVSAPRSTANQSAGFVDVQAKIRIASYPPSGKSWVVVLHGSNGYLFFINSTGTLEVIFYNGSSPSFPPASPSALPTSVFNTDIRIRAILNTTNAAVTEGGETVAAESVLHQYSTDDGATWIGLGTTGAGGGPMTASTSGTLKLALGDADTPASFTGRLYSVLARNAAGAVLYNPDFEVQASGATSFDDTSPTPSTFTVTSPAVIV